VNVQRIPDFFSELQDEKNVVEGKLKQEVDARAVLQTKLKQVLDEKIARDKYLEVQLVWAKNEVASKEELLCYTQQQLASTQQIRQFSYKAEPCKYSSDDDF